MKKLKLLTSLSTLGVLTAAAPIVVTACSNNEEEEYGGRVMVTPENKTITSTEPMTNLKVGSCVLEDADGLKVETAGQDIEIIWTDSEGKEILDFCSLNVQFVPGSNWLLEISSEGFTKSQNGTYYGTVNWSPINFSQSISDTEHLIELTIAIP